jgi:hypothetical protein
MGHAHWVRGGRHFEPRDLKGCLFRYCLFHSIRQSRITPKNLDFSNNFFSVYGIYQLEKSVKKCPTRFKLNEKVQYSL